MKEGDEIVLIEDDEDKAQAMINIIRHDLTTNIRHFEDGESALLYLLSPESQNTKLILLDLILPKVDGIEILKRLKEHPVKSLIPVMILTTSSQTESYVTSLGLKPDGFIHKPNNLRNCA
jgi:two-component system response regulator